MDALPPGFTFDHFIDGPCLRLNGEVIATACPANYDPGCPWRISLHPRRAGSTVFLATEAGARRYMAAWARRWETEIRERCAGPNQAFAHLLVSPPPGLDKTHPRRRHKRV